MFFTNSDSNLAFALGEQIVGQPGAIDTIVPCVQMYRAGLAPEGRPVGVFLLLGPTGTGKTRTVEALAQALHGSEKNLVRIDCGEFQMEHEVAKLIGAPPGYLGHRETHPMISQQKLLASTSEGCRLSIVLFDEVEKAAPSLSRLLLGVLDKATLHLGDNTVVNFEESLIFLTSNLGAREMFGQLHPDFGFQSGHSESADRMQRRLEKTAMNATRRFFSPEFVNRIDNVITYQPLSRDSLSLILDHQVERLRAHVRRRLGHRSFGIGLKERARQFLIDRGTSREFGARELNRTLHRHLTQPLAALVAGGEVWPGSNAEVDWDGESPRLTIRAVPGSRSRRTATLPEPIRLSA